MTGQIADKGEKAPDPGRAALAGRAHQRLAERLQPLAALLRAQGQDVIDAFFDLADTIITVRSLIRESWTLYRWHGRPAKRP